ncbi:GNAT family N-acetyltransferase [Candidatus Micrarchaeota archaeon]|nr:GNAT family N-acetyltransferase [Candidatus Micrarchaeota archaeon]
MNIQYKEIQTIPEFIDAIRLRVEVFINEQRFKPGWEPDEEDKNSKQFIAILDGKIVATMRIREPTKGEFKIERLAVAKECRGKGIGKELLEYSIKQIGTQKPKRIFTMSQVQAQKFYEKCNFKAVKEPEMAHGVAHIYMDYLF